MKNYKTVPQMALEVLASDYDNVADAIESLYPELDTDSKLDLVKFLEIVLVGEGE